MDVVILQQTKNAEALAVINQQPKNKKPSRMKYLLTTLLLAFTLNGFSQTQSEMNTEAYEAYQKADRELNTVYREILTTYKTDTTFIKALKKAQRIWIQFRDAELELKYPSYPEGHYGSIQPVCRSSYLQELTEARTQTLKTWITGILEGDLCAGSVKRK